MPISSAVEEGGERAHGDGDVLARAVAEYRCYGFGSLLAGLAFGVLAIAIEPLAKVLFLVVFFGLLFGIGMFVFVLARMARRALAAVSALDSYEPEGTGPMRRRVARLLALQIAGMLLLVAIGGLRGTVAAPFAGGAFLGMGMALLAMSQRFRRWEKENACLLLRAPHYRWRRDPQSGRRGGGIIDPRDFYVLVRP
jgi:hypothetical protein